MLFHGESAGVQPQEHSGEVLECRQLPRVNVPPLLLLESVDKEPSITEIGGDNDSRAPNSLYHRVL